MTYQNIIVETEDRIGIIEINRPKKLNALNQETIAELHQAFDQLNQDPRTRVIIITGSGEKAFVAFDPPLANRVRERPNLDAAILGNIEPGEEIEILGGPACNTRWVWWEVRSLSTNLQGWTAEGDGEDYWLVPLEE